MKINLFKEYTDCIKEPTSEAEVEMAMNVGSVILTKKMSAHEWNVGLMGGEEMSEAEFLDPLVEIPAPKEGWLERHRLYKNILPAWRTIHKIHACGLPEGTYEGPEGEKLSTTTYKMLRYAQAKNMKVKSSILGIDFYVTPDMSEEEAKLAPEMAILNHGAEMEKIMAVENIDVSGHTQAWAREKKKDPKSAEFAERLGKMMQAEMHSSGKPLDTQMFMRTATFQDQIRGDNGSRMKVRDMLFLYWKYGESLGQISGGNIEEIRRARRVCADAQKKPVNDGPDI